MSDVLEIELSKAIQVNDIEYTSIEVKKPSTKDFLELGLIFKFDEKQHGEINFKKVRQYMLKAGYPATLIDQLPPRVFIEYAGSLSSFFE